jgi:cell division septation protein DedD
VPAGKQTKVAQDEAVGAVWTVEAGTTTDPVQAVVLAHRLRAKGYEAYTVTGKVDTVMWYRVRVGRFDNRVQAKVLEIKLKQEEGLKEASVVQQ